MRSKKNRTPAIYNSSLSIYSLRRKAKRLKKKPQQQTHKKMPWQSFTRFTRRYETRRWRNRHDLLKCARFRYKTLGGFISITIWAIRMTICYVNTHRLTSYIHIKMWSESIMYIIFYFTTVTSRQTCPLVLPRCTEWFRYRSNPILAYFRFYTLIWSKACRHCIMGCQVMSFISCYMYRTRRATMFHRNQK